ncbi:hypothetical protein AYK24_03670 [Thermoplasmatales archaeon SG8-52-4]|nr:MAG: hypothetical protein AYK24_03670 [Thermoplasmatales archaeon SG8-52-4]
MSKRITNKDLLKEIQELKKDSWKQKFLAFASITVAYMLVGFSIKTYSDPIRDSIGDLLIIIGFIGFVYLLIKDSIMKKRLDK